MKITGNDRKIKALRLVHKGINLCYTKEVLEPFLGDYRENRLEPLSEGVIEFDDFREIDDLIHVLQEFKEDADLYLKKPWLLDRLRIK